MKVPSALVDPGVGQPATPPLPVPYPRTGQGGELTLPDAITGNPGDPRYPYGSRCPRRRRAAAAGAARTGAGARRATTAVHPAGATGPSSGELTMVTRHRRVARIATAVSLLSILAVAISVVAHPGGIASRATPTRQNFANTNGLYTGDEVRILGVAVGTIERIEPEPDAAKVTFTVDRKYPVPAEVKAAILSPSLVTARAVQWIPAYPEAPNWADGATIPIERTAVPIEWDDLRRQLEKLTGSLQPTTPGGPSALGEFINTAADNLRGQGDTARDTVIKLSQATSALGDHATDIFGTVRNLQLLVSALSSSSDPLASFNTNLADISGALSNSPNEIADATARSRRSGQRPAHVRRREPRRPRDDVRPSQRDHHRVERQPR